MHDVAPDGSPVDVYFALPAQTDLDRLRKVVPAGASVLDLGAGVGRLANPLAKAGHHVVAVDDAPAMLAHLDGPTPVVADIWTLDLAERFDVVLALSHLINGTSRSRRAQLLRVCRRHVRDHGLLIVQRYPPAWVPTEATSTVGPVTIRLHDIVLHSGWFVASVTYTLGTRSWTQRFDAVHVDDDELARLAADTGFHVGPPMDEVGAWVPLTAS